MKKLLAFILTLVMVASTFTMLPLSVSAGDGDTTPTLLTYSDGYAGQPAGSGTKDDPYKIASADDLLWMAKQHTLSESQFSGAEYGSKVPTTGCNNNPFSGKYFIQTADINLNGKVLPSIGFLNGSSKEFFNISSAGKYSLFGGNYNGQGFSISNGYIVNQDPSATTIQNVDLINYYYNTGLFGVISGATIENVNLSNIDLYTTEDLKISTAGLLVGAAVASISSDSDKTIVNRIINCSADSNCSLVAKNTSGGSNTTGQSHYWGGLVGAAYRTSIENCFNGANIVINETIYGAGGIVGQLLAGNVINCVNKGNISITNVAVAKTVYKYRTFGGIVGGIPYNNDDTGRMGITIKNCANYGSITNDNNAVVSFCCGGILGSTRKVREATLDIVNCYNLGLISTNGADSCFFAEGAIIGAIQVMSSSLTSNAYITARIDGVKTTEITGLNEGKVENDTGLQYSAKVGETVICNFTNLSNNEETNVEVVEKTSPTLNYDVISDKSKLAKEADMVAACDLGIQAHSTDAGKYRFFATIDGLNWDEAGFNITVNNGNKSVTKEFFVTVAYNSIEENGVTVTDINGRKFIVLVLENVEADWTFEINAYVEDSTGTYTTTTWTGEFG